MDGKMTILSSVKDGTINGSSVYSYTLLIDNIIKHNKVTREEIAKVISTEYPGLKKRIYNYFENYAKSPEELEHLDPTPKEQLVKSVLGIPVIIVDYSKEKPVKIATGIHTEKIGFQEDKFEEEDVEEYVHFKNNVKKKRRK